MSLNTVVIAALVVLVLVILAAILMGRLEIFTGYLGECPGQCQDHFDSQEGEFGCRPGYERIPGQCDEGDEVCCAPTGDDGSDDSGWW